MIRCHKTGFQAYLEPRGQWMYGDSYIFDGGELLLRVSDSTTEPTRDEVHYSILTWQEWWVDGDRVTTVVCNRSDYTNWIHGEELRGVPVGQIMMGR